MARALARTGGRLEGTWHGPRAAATADAGGGAALERLVARAEELDRSWHGRGAGSGSSGGRSARAAAEAAQAQATHEAFLRFLQEMRRMRAEQRKAARLALDTSMHGGGALFGKGGGGLGSSGGGGAEPMATDDGAAGAATAAAATTAGDVSPKRARLGDEPRADVSSAAAAAASAGPLAAAMALDEAEAAAAAAAAAAADADADAAAAAAAAAGRPGGIIARLRRAWSSRPSSARGSEVGSESGMSVDGRGAGEDDDDMEEGEAVAPPPADAAADAQEARPSLESGRRGQGAYAALMQQSGGPEPPKPVPPPEPAEVLLPPRPEPLRPRSIPQHLGMLSAEDVGPSHALLAARAAAALPMPPPALAGVEGSVGRSRRGLLGANGGSSGALHVMFADGIGPEPAAAAGGGGASLHGATPEGSVRRRARFAAAVALADVAEQEAAVSAPPPTATGPLRPRSQPQHLGFVPGAAAATVAATAPLAAPLAKPATAAAGPSSSSSGPRMVPRSKPRHLGFAFDPAPPPLSPLPHVLGLVPEDKVADVAALSLQLPPSATEPPLRPRSKPQHLGFYEPTAAPAPSNQQQQAEATASAPAAPPLRPRSKPQHLGFAEPSPSSFSPSSSAEAAAAAAAAAGASPAAAPPPAASPGRVLAPSAPAPLERAAAALRGVGLLDGKSGGGEEAAGGATRPPPSGAPITADQLADRLAAAGFNVTRTEVSHLAGAMPQRAEGEGAQAAPSALLASQLDWRELRTSYRDEWLSALEAAFSTLAGDDGVISAKDVVASMRGKLPAAEVDAALEDVMLEAAAEEGAGGEEGEGGLDFATFAALLDSAALGEGQGGGGQQGGPGSVGSSIDLSAFESRHGPSASGPLIR
jgi:hypothetical protein